MSELKPGTAAGARGERMQGAGGGDEGDRATEATGRQRARLIGIGLIAATQLAPNKTCLR